MKWMKGLVVLVMMLVLLVPTSIDAKTMSTNAKYLKKQFAAAEKGTLLDAKAKLYDRFTIKGKDASYGVDENGLLCVRQVERKESVLGFSF